ncbi:hypothetical protein RFI_06458 [Reticulomyxa filosa]|uniref:Uncharacterized protein n=1 Tax=Reticulomyxa filosa TaxID=46433 RepID=X6NXQ4_RETFI|nr:hypothetical protein RFI_06458 [Reticulomyxa filosa]|eukprot:ETO30663.1 hypothetical protein RFI_06458 [Reticulomyxa filosa]
MSTSPPARNTKGDSSHEEECYKHEDSRDARMASYNAREEEEEESNEDENNEAREENMEIDSDGYDTTLQMTDKKTQGGYDVNISRKRKDRTCRAEEKRVNSLIINEERQMSWQLFDCFGYWLSIVLILCCQIGRTNARKFQLKNKKILFVCKVIDKLGFFVALGWCFLFLKL